MLKEAYVQSPNGEITFSDIYKANYTDKIPTVHRSLGGFIKIARQLENAAIAVVYKGDVEKCLNTANPNAEYNRLALRREVVGADPAFVLSVSNPKYKNDNRASNTKLPKCLVTVREGSRHSEHHNTSTGYLGPNRTNLKHIMAQPPAAVNKRKPTRIKKCENPDAQANWPSNIDNMRALLTDKQIVSELNHYRLYHMKLPPQPFKSLVRRITGGKGYVDTSTAWVMDWAEHIRLVSEKKS